MSSTYEKNRLAWNREVEGGSPWTTPFGPEVIESARKGEWSVVLTPTKAVPREWFGELRGKDVLGLASGGGQQCPIFAAAGANVTSFDASDAQLASDRLVADRDGLSIRTVQGDMADLSVFPDESFDLVFNPCSTCFVEDVEPVWREVFRVLRQGGVFLAGFVHPWFYLFDEPLFDRGELVITKRLPVVEERDGMVEFSHTLDALLGGQMRAGLAVTGFYEDEWEAWQALHGVAPSTFATRAIKPAPAPGGTNQR